MQAQIRSPAPPEELIVLDGKTPRHGGGHSVLTAVPAPSQHYLGSAIVDQKTNEIPGERELFKKLALDGRKVSRDARHTQDQTARELLLEQGADFLLTVPANPPTLRANIQRLAPAPPARFFPSGSHSHAGGPACVQQVALLRRHLRQHSPKTVALVTSLWPEDLNAAQWLQFNRAAWGIESGLHQHPDVSHRDDQCRVRLPQSLRVIGGFRRSGNSLFMHWRSRQKKLQHKTTTNFFGAMNAEHHRYAIRCLQARQPNFQRSS